MDCAGRPGADLVTPGLAQGSPDDDYPLNEQSDPAFNVGGVKRTLPDDLQLEQILSYMEATYPRPSEEEDVDRYLALLPDRLTHAAMLMLGSAVDHTMPAVAYAGDVQVEDTEFGTLLRPSQVRGTWVVAYADLGPRAREFAWQPELAAAAELAGAVILDVNSRDGMEPAISYAREQGAREVVAWLHRTFFDTSADRAVYSFPPTFTGLPEKALVQVKAGTGRFSEYHVSGEISTPAEARRRIRDVAEFLGAGSAELEGGN